MHEALLIGSDIAGTAVRVGVGDFPAFVNRVPLSSSWYQS